MRLCPFEKSDTTSWPQWNAARKMWAEDNIPMSKSWLALAKKRQHGWYRDWQRHPDKWVSKLLEVDTPTQLHALRRSNFNTLPRWARQADSGRTETRCIRERVPPRWCEAFAKMHPDAAAEKPLGSLEPFPEKATDIPWNHPAWDLVKQTFRENVPRADWANPVYQLIQPFRDVVNTVLD